MKNKEKSIKNLIENKDILKLLADNNIKKRYKKAILNGADKNLIKAIEDSVFNLLRGNLNFSQEELNKISKYKNTLRKLIGISNIKSKRKNISLKRRIS